MAEQFYLMADYAARETLSVSAVENGLSVRTAVPSGVTPFLNRQAGERDLGVGGFRFIEK